MDEVVGMPVGMNGKRVPIKRTEHHEVATDPVHRQDLRCSRGDATPGPTDPVSTTTADYYSDVQKDVLWSSHRRSALKGTRTSQL